jgi:hypothetical protein
MKNICFVVALVLVPLWVPTPAYASEKQSADGEVSTECGGPWSGQSGSCSFQCRADDILYVRGSARFDGRGAFVRVGASCGGVTLECFASRRPFYAACQATSADTGPSFDDKSGSCVVEGLAGDTFACGSVAPEPKERESSGENNL